MLPLLAPWPKAGRVGLWFVSFICTLLGVMLGYVFWATDELYGPDYSSGDRVFVRAFGLVFFAGPVFFIGLARLQVWLAGDRLIKQGAFWRSRLDLRRARFSMSVKGWDYETQLPTGAVRTVHIESPVLVVRTSWRRVKLPLAQRDGHRITPGDQVVVAWLPADLREALAAAIDEYATDPQKAKVSRFLRHVERSPIQPEGSADLPGL
jgi:hypothetical protein